MQRSPRTSSWALALLLLLAAVVVSHSTSGCARQDGGPCDSKQMAEQQQAEPKDRWPELVGQDADTATAVIKADAPAVSIQVLPHGSMATMDYRFERVRLWMDEAGKVKEVPMRG